MQADPAGKPEPLPADNRAELAYELIEDMIVQIEPGVRHASDGLLIWLPRRGMVVRDINFSAQMKVFEVRRALPQAARGGDPGRHHAA